MKDLKQLLKEQRILVGMIHVQALPGTPKNKYAIGEITGLAVEEAKTFQKLGLKAVMIENMHDVPYMNRSVGPEITAAMTRIGHEVKQTGLYCGIQVLAGANKDALAAAHASGLDFIRAEGYVFSHVADEGFMDSCAGELLRYRRQIGAEDVMIFTDIKKKHSSHAITSDISIAETAHAAEFFLSDGVVVTGAATGLEASVDEVRQVKEAVKIPVAVGSGITPQNLKNYHPYADMFIVGSYIKEGGCWQNDLDRSRITALVKEFDRLTNSVTSK